MMDNSIVKFFEVRLLANFATERIFTISAKPHKTRSHDSLKVPVTPCEHVAISVTFRMILCIFEKVRCQV